MHIVDTLVARGFIQQSTGLPALKEAMDQGPITFYVGFDPTADSLHVGHLVQVLIMRWIQAAGHKAIAVVGGGTGMVGDPSGKTEMRAVLSEERIAANLDGMRAQLGKLLVIDGERGVMVNNADWLLSLNYIAFLRDIGRHFSVNRMLAAEAYKLRLEKGLSFIEFNYQLLQAYDFLALFRSHGCTLQIGGDDQWGNILAGTDLIRRVEQADAHGLTTPLITTASGAKMGKTAGGAVWLDPSRTSPFDLYQYWVNVDDRDVGRFLRLYTELPLDEVAALEALPGAEIRDAKHRLAWEITRLIHGEAEADASRSGAAAMVAGAADDALPTVEIAADALRAGVRMVEVLQQAGITRSNGEGRRLIQGGGVRLDNARIDDPDALLDAARVGAEGAVLRVGKKRAVRVVSSL